MRRRNRSRRRGAGKEAMVDCEHFFDGYKANPDYALACARTAYRSRRALGRALRHQWRHPAVGSARDRRRRDRVGMPGDHLGIHAHDDTGQAVANSLAAIEAGVRQIQGTLNGIGERCGNANLVTHHPDADAEAGLCQPLRNRRSTGRLQGLTRLSRNAFDELLNRSPDHQAPYVGASAFATKAGIHASALVKEPADLRACAARDGRQHRQGDGVRPGRQVELFQ
jgi:2-isopropylmalate synthase